MWEGDQAARPPLQELLESELNIVSYDFSVEYVRNSMIDEVVYFFFSPFSLSPPSNPPPQGQEFWLQNYAKKLEEPVPWSDFKQKFYQFMRLPLPRNEEDRFDTDTKRLLFFKIALNATREEMVTFESFAKVCDAFGRVKPHSYDFFDTIQV